MILFRQLTDEELVDVLSICVTKKYVSGNAIFAEGDSATKFYLIRDGEVRISKIIPSIGEEALAILKSGDFFGEMALIDEQVRSAHAFAHKDCTLMEIQIKEMQNLLRTRDGMACKFLLEFCKILAARLRATNEKFYGLFAMSAFFK